MAAASSKTSSLSLDCDEEYSEFCETFAFDLVSVGNYES